MTQDQKADLKDNLSQYYCAVDIQQRNITFPAYSLDAVEAVKNIVADLDLPAGKEAVVTGVFPAHIAARLAKAREYYRRPENLSDDGLSFPLLVPVSVPTDAKDGETRGFIHHHWEWL
jgi:hypothetical protein